MDENKQAYRLLVRKPEEKRPPERTIRRWVNNDNMNPREIEWGVTDWTDLAQDRGQWKANVNTVINFWTPLRSS
jgi:hypothetical protein